MASGGIVARKVAEPRTEKVSDAIGKWQIYINILYIKIYIFIYKGYRGI